ncbi:MAG: hypothetical protein ABSC55_24215 [Syntrophorhabdales bacterium]|jgi:hypothetical protein
METKNELRCPVCGSSDFEVTSKQGTVSVPFGPEIAVEDETFICRVCSAAIDFSRSYDESRSNALEQSRRGSVDSMIDYLSKEGYSLAAMERALDLPQRTMSRWKSTGEVSSTGMALLRIVRTFPWVLQVAQAKFEPIQAYKIFLQNAVSTLVTMTQHSSNTWFQQAVPQSQSVFCFFVYPQEPNVVPFSVPGVISLPPTNIIIGEVACK